ncbi:DUF4097 family beta strand repeat-containing protein [Ningiella sp. W23]|uniref:DUF4097 family beta strand repeat-containing protein n=1 Tax=Ningiella sp. W23 TaxID=3023715 RepID=UPI003756AE88
MNEHNTHSIKRVVGASVLALVVSIGSISLAYAGEKVDEVMDADPNGIVQIEHTSGTAEIRVWDKSQVSISGELGDDTEEFIFERNGKTVEIIIKVEENRSWGNWNAGSIDGDDILIYVPTNARVNYDAVNANVNIDGVQGGSSLELVNGDISAKNLNNSISLQTVNGDIDAQSMQGSLDVETINGDVKIGHVGEQGIKVGAVNGNLNIDSNATEITAETVNGDMDFNLQGVSTVEANTVNGSLELSMSLLPSAVVNLSSVGGSIELELPSDVQAQFDIEAHAGGSIRNRLSDDEPQKAEYGPRRWLRFSAGNPDARVDITTVNGRITLSEQ